MKEKDNQDQIVENADKKKDKKPAAKKGKAKNISKKSAEHLHVHDHSDDEEPVKVGLAYKIGRYNDDESPTCIYLPTRQLLFKMMRACIGVEEPEELWIYNSATGFTVDEPAFYTSTDFFFAANKESPRNEDHAKMTGGDGTVARANGTNNDDLFGDDE